MMAKVVPLRWMSTSAWAVAATSALSRLPARSTASRVRRAIGRRSSSSLAPGCQGR
jgi:hypothetical protein